MPLPPLPMSWRLQTKGCIEWQSTMIRSLPTDRIVNMFFNDSLIAFNFKMNLKCWLFFLNKKSQYKMVIYSFIDLFTIKRVVAIVVYFLPLLHAVCAWSIPTYFLYTPLSLISSYSHTFSQENFLLSSHYANITLNHINHILILYSCIFSHHLISTRCT